ncbi:TetR/AcrR family transcriptional regulator [Polymorphospora rubra]|uniref:TetR/AcrR family transcriptional regulator n=1 Tax=Polymorphospora rubra TaxID=338584 RepID=UPI0033D64103
MPGSDSPPRADAARNRERLLHAARQALAEGDRSLQLNDVARRAGVGVGTAYRHFPTPRALLETLVQAQLDDALDQARRELTAPDPWAGLTRLLTTGIALLVSDPGFAEVLAAGTDTLPRTSQLKQELYDAVDQLLRRVRDVGALRPGVDGDDILRLMCGVSYAARLAEDTGSPAGPAGPSGLAGSPTAIGELAGRYAGWLLDALRAP